MRLPDVTREADQSPTPKSGARALLILTLIGAVLRLFMLSAESLWLDEGHTFFETTQDWSSAFLDKTQGPVFIALEKLVTSAFGASEWSLRLLPACFGIAAIPALFLLARRLFDVRTALFAALLAATNPTWIHYSQDARPYSLLLLAVILTMWSLLRWLADPRIGNALLYLLCALTALYTHAYGALILPLALLVALISLPALPGAVRPRAWKTALLLGLLTAVLSIPAVMQYAGKLAGRMTGDAQGGWIRPPSPLMLLTVVQHYFMYPVLTIAAGLLVINSLVRHGWVWAKRFRSVLILTASYLAFVALPWLISVTLAPVVVPRYTLPASIGVLIAVAWSVSTLMPILQRLWTLALILITTIGLIYYYQGSDKDPWRETAQYLNANVRAGDLVVMSPGYVAEPLSFYYHAAPGVAAAAVRRATPVDSVLDDHARVWLVTAYGAEQGDLLGHLHASVALGREFRRRWFISPYRPPNPYALWQAAVKTELYARTER
jgi:mannosyltransferase